MKQLIVSLKTSSEALSDFKVAYNAAKKKKLRSPHYEISFDNRKDFERFIKNIFVLTSILNFKPKSVYELAKLTEMDVSNLNKIILFFEKVGAVRIEKAKAAGRIVKRPIVDYDKIQFDLRSVG